MNDERWDAPVDELLSYVEGDANRWEDAAHQCEHAARIDSALTAPTWRLLAAVYRERAQNHRDLVNRMRSRNAA